MEKYIIIFLTVLLKSSICLYSQGLAINATGNNPHNSAMLDIDVTGLIEPKGILIPRMTSAERDLITPETSLLIFNTETNCFEYWAYSMWQKLGCACITNPATPTEGFHILSQTEIVWNWLPVSGANGYMWHTVDDFSGATNNGNSTTITLNLLTPNTPYTLYIWAYNACGKSLVLELNETTLD